MQTNLFSKPLPQPRPIQFGKIMDPTPPESTWVWDGNDFRPPGFEMDANGDLYDPKREYKNGIGDRGPKNGSYGGSAPFYEVDAAEMGF